jgi:uncharacterized protein YegL
MRIQLNTKKFLIFVLLSLLLGLNACKTEEPEQVEEPKPPQKDVILVLDTSLSMVGKGAGSNNIMPQVKQSLDRYINEINQGDSFTFVTFDTIVEVYPTIQINDEGDKDILKKYVSIVDAEGLWTYTMEMMRNVLKIADDIQQQNNMNNQSERKEVIIILTDALDDPPPSDRAAQLDIKSLAGQHSGEDWYIFFVNLGELASNEQIQQLREELQLISKNAEVITTDDPAQAMDTVNNTGNTQTQTTSSDDVPIYQSPWFYLVLVLLVLIAILVVYFQYVSKIKLSGYIEYKNKVVLGATYSKANLTRYEERRVSIGRDSLCEVRIPDFESNKPIVLEAAMIKGQVQVFINTERGGRVSIIEGQSEPFLADGTRFEAGGYDFVFHTQK